MSAPGDPGITAADPAALDPVALDPAALDPVADPARLDALLDAEGLSTSTAAPSPLSWAGDVVERAGTELFDHAMPSFETGAGVAVVVLGVAGALAVLLFGTLAWRLYRRRAPSAAAAAPGTAALAARPAPPSLAEVDARLAAGDAPGALHALWRWVAAGVEARGYAHPSPDRTNRELLAEVRRAAPGWERLPPFVQLTDAVDAHLYGGVPLDPAAVRALVPLARQVMA